MIKVIENIIYLYKLKKKYKFSYSPFIKLNQGSYIVYPTGAETIKVNPFNKHFKETLLHEIGHMLFNEPKGFNSLFRIWKYRSAMEDTLYYNGNDLWLRRLDQEARASKFARRSYKKADVGQLLTWFYTYSASGYYYFSRKGSSGKDRVYYTDHIVKCINKIRGVKKIE